MPKWNYIQALLSQGDRRIGEILLSVHRLHGNWDRALKEIHVNPGFYVYRPKQPDEILPWNMIALNVSTRYLMREYEKAMEEIGL